MFRDWRHLPTFGVLLSTQDAQLEAIPPRRDQEAGPLPARDQVLLEASSWDLWCLVPVRFRYLSQRFALLPFEISNMN